MPNQENIFDPESEKREIEEIMQAQDAEEKKGEEKLADEIRTVERLDKVTDEAERRETAEKNLDKED